MRFAEPYMLAFLALPLPEVPLLDRQAFRGGKHRQEQEVLVPVQVE